MGTPYAQKAQMFMLRWATLNMTLEEIAQDQQARDRFPKPKPFRGSLF